MIIRAEDRKQVLTPNARGGDGTLDKRDYVLENMPENAKMFAEIKLEPGCSLGTHTHTGEYEVFFSMRARSRSTTTAPSAKCTPATSPSAMTARVTASPTARTSPRRCLRPSSRPSKETP